MADSYRRTSEPWPQTGGTWRPLTDQASPNMSRRLPSIFDDGDSVLRGSFHTTHGWRSRSKPRDQVLEDVTLPPLRHPYMSRPSASSPDASTCDFSFMHWYPKGAATLTYVNNDGQLESVSSVNPWIFEERCPLLARAFEPSRFGPKLHLEALNSTTANPFLRYLYTGTYALQGGRSGHGYEDVPTSVLFHCQLYRLGDIYDLRDLKQQANVNVTRQCEFGCSSPQKPIDLCPAIEYVYQHLREHTDLLQTIICYCVTCFLRHRLAEDDAFRTMAYTLRPFHQDLCKESMKRKFEDETAAAIIQLPFQPYSPIEYASREDLSAGRCRDVVHRFHASDDYDGAAKKRKRQEPRELIPSNAVPLSLRLNRERHAQDHSDDESDLQLPSKKKLSVLGETQEPAESASDAEYEVVSGLAPVEELSSDNESDADTPVVVEYSSTESESEAEQELALPIQDRNTSSSAVLVPRMPVENSGSRSDSEWSIV